MPKGEGLGIKMKFWGESAMNTQEVQLRCNNCPSNTGALALALQRSDQIESAISQIVTDALPEGHSRHREEGSRQDWSGNSRSSAENYVVFIARVLTRRLLARHFQIFIQITLLACQNPLHFVLKHDRLG